MEDLCSFHGYVSTPNDALLLFEACRLNRLKRTHRRLSESERTAYVTSGAVFIWDEEESGIKRWTDGKHWSPSRINGSFLIYREVEARKVKLPNAAEEKTEYVIKEDGLTKKAISITTADGRKQHLVSYYNREDLNRKVLQTPAELPLFEDVVISTDIYPEFMPENPSSSASSSRSSLSSSFAPSINSTSSAETTRPTYVPVSKHKPRSSQSQPRDNSPYRYEPPALSAGAAALRKHPYDSPGSDLPRPSQDSGKQMSIYSSNDDSRSFRSFDSGGRSWDFGTNTDRSSMRSFGSGDRDYPQPDSFNETVGVGLHRGYQVIVPGQLRELRYDHTPSSHSPFSNHQMESPARPLSVSQIQRSPSMLSSMTAPADIERNASQYLSQQDSYHAERTSVRSLPVGTTETRSGYVLPIPKLRDEAPVSSFGSSHNSTSNVIHSQPPMFLAHANWSPGMGRTLKGGSLEGIVNKSQQQQQQREIFGRRSGMGANGMERERQTEEEMDWEPGEGAY